MDFSTLDTSHVTHLTLVVQPGVVYINSDKVISAEKDSLPMPQTVAEPPVAVVPEPPKEEPLPRTALEIIQDELARLDKYFAVLTFEQRKAILAPAIRATYDAKKVCRAQDYGALMHLIVDEHHWLPSTGSKKFLEFLRCECGIEANDLPAESTLRVLGFGKTIYPSWVISGYTGQMQGINEMTAFFVQVLLKFVDQSQQND